MQSESAFRVYCLWKRVGGLGIRGLISLSDDLDILVSRQVNDPARISGLINPTGRALAPERAALRPHPHFLAWHRENCFKQ